MNKYYTIIFFSIVLFSACRSTKQSLYQTIVTEGGIWSLVWNDEFNYTGLPDSTKWSFDVEGNAWNWGNNEAQWYTANNPENAFVENSMLTITALKKQSNGKEYTSARLRTKNKGDWKYGRIEVSAKLPTGIGTWPAIWMLPTDKVYGNWPKSGEIDIMEHVGHNLNEILSTVHTEKYNHTKGTQVGEITICPTATSQFHVYSIEWDENEIRSYIDNKLYFTFKNDKSGSAAWPFDQRFHLLLNIAIGGNLGGKKGIDDSSFPNKMQVDYVRIYTKR